MAEEKAASAGEASRMGTAMSYIPSLSTVRDSMTKAAAYVPSKETISAYIPTSLTPAGGGEEDAQSRILWTSFDSENGLFLVVGYVDGWEIWNLQDANNVYCMVSKMDGPIKLARLVSTGEVAEKSALSGSQPCVTVVSAEDSLEFPVNIVKFFSLSRDSYVHQLTFRSEVLSLLSTNNRLVVILPEQAFVFNLATMETVCSVATFPCPHDRGVVALGSRWLAFPTNLAVPSIAAHPCDSLGSDAMNLSRDVVWYLSSAFSAAATLGKQAVAAYLKQPVPEPPKAAPKGSAGTVVVRDLVSDSLIAHFQAHDSALSCMTFDPTGLLLATASVDGHNVNVFQIVSCSGESQGPKHLYNLVRGVSTSVIQDITFSIDSRWLAVSTSRGTTHMFPVSIDGAEPCVRTHVPGSSEPAPHYLYNPRTTAPQSNGRTVYSVARLKHGLPLLNQDVQPRSQFPPPLTSAFHSTFPPAIDCLYIITHAGLLTRYRLEPHAPQVRTDANRGALELSYNAVATWHIGRHTGSLRASPADITIIRTAASSCAPPEMGSVDWLSQAETVTHDPHRLSLWADNQFKLQVFTPDSVGAFEAHEQCVDAFVFPEFLPTSPQTLQRQKPPAIGNENVMVGDVEINDFFVVPSAPPLPETKVEEGLRGALSTNMWQDDGVQDVPVANFPPGCYYHVPDSFVPPAAASTSAPLYPAISATASTPPLPFSPSYPSPGQQPALPSAALPRAAAAISPSRATPRASAAASSASPAVPPRAAAGASGPSASVGADRAILDRQPPSHSHTGRSAASAAQAGHAGGRAASAAAVRTSPPAVAPAAASLGRGRAVDSQAATVVVGMDADSDDGAPFDLSASLVEDDYFPAKPPRRKSTQKSPPMRAQSPPDLLGREFPEVPSHAVPSKVPSERRAHSDDAYF